MTKHDGDNGEQTPGHDPAKWLGIYLDDHWAAAGAGCALAKRLAEQNEGTQWYAELRRIADEVELDEQTLQRLRETRGKRGFSVKRLVAQGAERIGRLKPNGALTGYTPLARVLELEALIAGVRSKRLLWRSLRQTDAARDVDLDQLESRAKAQVDTLQSIHKEATALAFGMRRVHEPAMPT